MQLRKIYRPVLAYRTYNIFRQLFAFVYISAYFADISHYTLLGRQGHGLYILQIIIIGTAWLVAYNMCVIYFYKKQGMAGAIRRRNNLSFKDCIGKLCKTV
jgi:hypothetical protein